MMKSFVLLVSACLALPAIAQESEEKAPTEEDVAAYVAAFYASLDPQTGLIALPDGSATMNVPETFYYLSPADARKVLEDEWGNPPDGSILGMIFPTTLMPLDDQAWGVTIQYLEDGYVSDADADDIDYGELLAQMKDDTKQLNKLRIRDGYLPIELIGWAATPQYDKATHKLYWAKELRFGDAELNTLNYNIRILGRKGYLLLNFVAAMDQLPEIEKNVESVLAMADFDQGARYTDFNPDIDTVAAYGIGGLIAGAVLSKAGVLAMALVLMKKFWIVIVALVVGVAITLRSVLFGERIPPRQ